MAVYRERKKRKNLECELRFAEFSEIVLKIDIRTIKSSPKLEICNDLEFVCENTEEPEYVFSNCLAPSFSLHG